MTDTSWLGPPIDVRPLFAGQQAAFIALLRGLSPGQWALATVCPGWDVKDIAAHVLGDLARVDGDRQLAATALQIVSIIWSSPGSGTSDT